MSDMNKQEINKYDIQELQESLNPTTFQNARAEDFHNSDAYANAQVTVHRTDTFTDNHQQA
jgi:hypothetical protein